MTLKLPPAPLEYDPVNAADNRRLAMAADERNFKRGQDLKLAAGERLVLKAPNGSLWKVAVSNAGVLSASAYP